MAGLLSPASEPWISSHISGQTGQPDLTKLSLAKSNTPLQRAARAAFVFAAIFAFIMAALPHPPPIPGQPSDKILHVLAFATLGALSAVGFPGQSVARLFAALTAFGATIELVQAIPALNRDSELADLIADMAAALAALVVSRGLLAILARRRSS